MRNAMTRDRMIVAVCVLAVLSVVGGILIFHQSGDDAGDTQPKQGQGKRVESGEGIFIGGPFLRLIFGDERPDASQAVSGTNNASAVRTTMSSAGSRAASVPAARPAVVAPARAPACAAGLVASVVGLLGTLLGGGGGC